MRGITQEQANVVVDRLPLVLAHVVGGMLVAGDSGAECRLVVRRERLLDDLPALGVEYRTGVAVLGLPVSENSTDRPQVAFLRDTPLGGMGGSSLPLLCLFSPLL
jgi:hypothetical protein